jgi:hypothetical protein
MSVYPSTKQPATPPQGQPGGFVVEITTDKIRATATADPAAAPSGPISPGSSPAAALRRGRWDICWRGTILRPHGRRHERHLGRRPRQWDHRQILNLRLPPPRQRRRIASAYCTGNDIDQHIQFGYKRLKLAMHGPADGAAG